MFKSNCRREYIGRQVIKEEEKDVQHTYKRAKHKAKLLRIKNKYIS
jgi:hypothetical protein